MLLISVMETVTNFEEKVRKDLTEYLQREDAIDAHVPECPDVEEKWAYIGRAYLPDGVREFQQYPTVSLGWIMFVGMALARYWDTDWTKYADRTDIYESLRDTHGYDNLDDTVLNEVLGLEGKAAEKLSQLVARCAGRADSLLRHEHVENGTPEAFGCYVAALHQLYLAGMAVELKSLGYHMTPMGM